MAEGWAAHPGDRHHGAHGGAASRMLDLPEDAFLDFSQNINPLGTPPGVLEAAANALTKETGHYPDLSYPRLREALGDYLGVSAGNVVPTNGGAEALFLAARSAGTSGNALVLEPTFSEYAAAARAAGLEPTGRVVRVPESNFRLEREALNDLAGVRIVFLCNPNNPTGEALEKGEVLDIADRVKAAGAVLVVDEAFADFAPKVSVVAEVGEHLLVARSFTKFFAIPGLRLGCLVCADPAPIRALQPSWPVNAVAAAAGIAAARDGAFAAGSIVEVERLRARLAAALDALPGVEVFPGAANFLLARGPENLVERLARRGVLVRGCEPFLGLGRGFFRVAVRGDGENAALLDNIREEL